jgi:hypothetical protein
MTVSPSPDGLSTLRWGDARPVQQARCLTPHRLAPAAASCHVGQGGDEGQACIVVIQMPGAGEALETNVPAWGQHGGTASSTDQTIQDTVTESGACLL